MGVGCTAHAPENASMFEDDMAFAATLRVLDAGDPAVMAEQRGRFGTIARRPGEMAEPHHRRVDPLLRPVLPNRARSPAQARQHLPEALGREKVPTTADPQTLQPVVDRAAH
jgi:hypothetical protein